MTSHVSEDSLDFVDENEEWAKIERVMASLDTGLSGEVVDDEDGIRVILEGKNLNPSYVKLDGELANGKSPYFKNNSCTAYNERTLTGWLFTNNLTKYEHFLITNGFDDMRFMGPEIMSEADLIELGLSVEDAYQLISSTQLIRNSSSSSPSSFTSVKDWLTSLNLPDYYETFAMHGCATIDDLLNIWDLQLTSVFDISKLGHRNRIMSSINSLRSSVKRMGSKDGVTNGNGCHNTPVVPKPVLQNICLTDYLLHRQNPNYNNYSNLNHNNHLGDVSLFKDYSSLKSNKSGRSSASSTLRRSEETGQGLEVITLEEVLRNCGVLEPVVKVVTPSSPTATTNILQPTSINNQSVSINNNNHHQHCLSNFLVTYLGTVKLLCIEKPDLARKCIEQIRLSPVENRKVVISVSYKQVIFRDQLSQEIMGSHDVSSVFCVCQDSELLEYFAFVTWDVEESVHFCHVFNAQYIKLSTDVVLALGKAFEVAFQLIQQEVGKQNGRSLSSSLSVSPTSPTPASKVKGSRPKTMPEKRSTFV